MRNGIGAGLAPARPPPTCPPRTSPPARSPPRERPSPAVSAGAGGESGGTSTGSGSRTATAPSPRRRTGSATATGLRATTRAARVGGRRRGRRTRRRRRARSRSASTRGPSDFTTRLPLGLAFNRTCEPLKPAPPAPTGPARISVRAAEFSLILSRPSLPAGEAIVELNNRGEDPHDLDLSPAGSSGVVLDLPEVESLQRTSAPVNLEPGTYEFYCSLPNHRGSGMEATLTVEG